MSSYSSGTKQRRIQMVKTQLRTADCGVSYPLTMFDQAAKCSQKAHVQDQKRLSVLSLPDTFLLVCEHLRYEPFKCP